MINSADKFLICVEDCKREVPKKVDLLYLSGHHCFQVNGVRLRVTEVGSRKAYRHYQVQVYTDELVKLKTDLE
jgi:hypothetical protein